MQIGKKNYAVDMVFALVPTFMDRGNDYRESHVLSTVNNFFDILNNLSYNRRFTESSRHSKFPELEMFHVLKGPVKRTFGELENEN